ncbi:MAG: PAC2 family protein, partial [Anaerolineales bacterium]
VHTVLDLLEKYGVKELYTLGGYGLGRLVPKPGVLGAATHMDLVEKMKKYGIQFRQDEPGGGIVGASGLFLGLGKLRDMRGVCLMGETSGYLVDPKSAQAVLEMLGKVLNIELRFERLESKAKEMDRIAQQLRDMERKAMEKPHEELRYIG